VPPFADGDLLDLWERGTPLHPLDRGLLCLRLAGSEVNGESVADWPVGRRNRALLELRDACFGPSLGGWTACPRCGEQLELDLDGPALLAGVPVEDAPSGESIVVADRVYRLPTSRDLAKIAHETDERVAAVNLLESCRVGGGPPPDWSDADLEVVGDRLALADPFAEPALALTCPSCANVWDEPLDVLAFLWSDVEVRARRLLREVHRLASAYGWSERDILALSPARRALYLELVAE
jgi:hypothetical protein